MPGTRPRVVYGPPCRFQIVHYFSQSAANVARVVKLIMCEGGLFTFEKSCFEVPVTMGSIHLSNARDAAIMVQTNVASGPSEIIRFVTQVAAGDVAK